MNTNDIIFIASFLLSAFIVGNLIRILLRKENRYITIPMALSMLILFVGLAYGFVFIMQTGHTSFVKNRAVVSCSVDAPYASDEYCTDELYAYMIDHKDINLSEEIDTVYRQNLNLTDAQKTAIESLACTTPEKNITLSVQHRSSKFQGVDSPGTKATISHHIRTVESNGVRYVAFKNDDSPEKIKRYVLNRFDSLNYAISWQVQDGGWVSYTSYQGWDELLTQEVKADNTPNRLSISGIQETITCPN